jgi:acetyltransferase-like isoleucine patch superfamily enzyme
VIITIDYQDINFLKMIKKLYLSPAGFLISFVMNTLGVLQRPFMVYGFFNRVDKKFKKRTRISSTVTILEKKKLDLKDNCWVWHYSILDATNGIKVGPGCQIGAWVGIFTHSSHLSIRLLGRKYIEIDREERIGYQHGSVEVGEYSFIAANSIILPNVKIGKGCLISAGSIVSKSVPDHSIVSGNPAKVIGKVTQLDSKFFKEPLVQELYFDDSIIREWLAKKDEKGEASTE